MGPTVIYEEEISLLDPSAPEVDVATTATTKILTNPATSQVALQPTFVHWKSELEQLAAQAVKEKSDYQSHTGLTEWHAYINSSACAGLLKTLATQPFERIEKQLVQHWNGLFLGRTVAAFVNAFKEKLKAEILIPARIKPDEKDLLEGQLIWFAEGRVTTANGKIPGYFAADKRFETDQPVVLLSWGESRPWSIIIPGKGYIQPTTFQYTDSRGKVWDSGTVISEVYLKWLEREQLKASFAQLKHAYEGMTSNYSLGWQLHAVEKRIESLSSKISAWSKVSLPTKTLNELVQRTELFENNDPAASRGLLLEGPSGTGKTLTARAIAEATNCYFEAITLADVKQKELGSSSQKVREIWVRAREKQPALLFFDECEGVFGQRGAAETDVVGGEIVKTMLAEWNDDIVRPRIMVIGATNRPDMIDSAIMSRFDWKLTVALPDRQERLDILKREMLAMDANSVVPNEMGELTQGMSGRDLRNLASQVRTIAYPNTPTAERFFEAVRSARKANNTKVDENATWDTIAIDPAALEKLQLFCQLLRNSESWSAQGIEVPKSLLLYGPPGTGKTQIARTLANESGLGFTAATSADVKGIHLGESGNRVKLIFNRARGQAPAILFLDEIDIVAPKRGATKDPLTEEIVGQLLQEMDGIEAHANQVFVVAATNRPDAIDPAIFDRFQKRIEVPLPDHSARVKLLTTRLAKKKLSFDIHGAVQALADRTDGKSHRDLVGLIGEAEEKALMRAINNGGPDHFSLKLEDFN